MAAEFHQIAKAANNLALYHSKQEGAAANAVRALYFLYLGPDDGGDDDVAEPPPKLSYEDSWTSIGAYFFAAPMNDPAKADLQALFDAIGVERASNARGLAWVAAADSAAPLSLTVPITFRNTDGGQVRGGALLPLLNLGAEFPSNSEVQVDFSDQPALRFSPTLARVIDGRVEDRLMPDGGTARVTFDPGDSQLGLIAFSATWTATQFFGLVQDDIFNREPPFGGEMRFFRKATPPGGSVAEMTQLVYPMFKAPSRDTTFALDVTLDPLDAADPARPNATEPPRTAFRFKDGVGPVETLRSPFARSIAGDVVELVPQSGMGFYLGRRWDRKQDGETAAYLALMGTMRVSYSSADERRLMCGLSGLEYLSLADGDLLLLHPACPAFADLEDPDAALTALAETGEAPILQNKYTTSWISISKTTQNRETETEPAYFSQPMAATNFSKHALKDTNYAVATAARIIAPEAASAFPMALYGGVFPPSSSDRGWPNRNVPGRAFESFETAALGPARYQILAAPVAGGGPTLCNEAGAPISGGKSITPTGLLAELGNGGPNPALLRSMGAESAVPDTPVGKFAQLVLGESDLGPLMFTADSSGEVDERLVRALLNNQTFAVLNNWKRYGPYFKSDVRVSDVVLRLSPADLSRETILVFKYADGETLKNLVDHVSNWDDTENFIGGAEEVTSAQATLKQAIVAAQEAEEKHPGPFAYFLNTIVCNPFWTGIIVFNAPVDGRTMPPDFQMVLGGIDGQLRAHHFGLEANKIDDSGDAPEIQETSFFGVFYYNENENENEDENEGETEGDLATDNALVRPDFADDQEADYAYRTTELIIVIANSQIGQFSSEVAVTLNVLFGRPVRGLDLTDAPAWELTEDGPERNTLRISGDYQVIDGIGRVIFSADLRRAYGFNAGDVNIRVLDKFFISGATLSPITAKEELQLQGDAVTIRSRISLSGKLAFSKKPFPRPDGAPPIDLFGYGSEDGIVPKGLPVNGLALDIKFELGPNGREGGIDITPQFAAISVQEDRSALRKGAMTASFPMVLSGFLSDETDLEAMRKSAKLVNIPDLMAAGKSADEDDRDLNTVQSINPVTPNPRFALRYEMPLGSLGDQATVGFGLSAGLVLGWGPNTAMPDADGVSIYVQLPALEGGVAGFDLQGLVKTTFGDANLARIKATADAGEDEGVYVLLFNNVAISVLGIQLPPKVISDFVLFCNPANPGESDIAWSLAATQVT